MRRVDWSRGGLDDLADQITYLAADNPAAAQQIAGRIRSAAAALGDFATGHPGRFAGTYEKSVRGLPYILVYMLVDSDRCVSILRVIRTARDWREGERPE